MKDSTKKPVLTKITIRKLDRIETTKNSPINGK